MSEVTLKELKKFKITLLVLPIIPCVILWYKHYITAAITIIAVCWLILFLMLSVNLFGINIDRSVYKLVKKILAFLGSILSGLALIFVWFCTILPTGIIAKCVKRDRLRLNKSSKSSYWKDVVEKEPSYENQY